MSHRPLSNRKWIHAGAAVALGLGLAVLALVALWTDPREAKALRSHGSILGVTAGNQHLVAGANWQKTLLFLWPDLEDRIGGVVASPPAHQGSTLFVWRFLKERGRGRVSLGDGFDYPPRFISVSDETGSRLEEFCNPSLGWSKTREFQVYGLTRFPRRGEKLRVRVEPTAWEREHGTGEALEFLVPNPTPGPFPLWRPDPLTMHQEQSGLEVALTSFLTGSVRERNPEAGTRFTLRLTERDRPAGERWRLEDAEIVDATGNRWHHGLSVRQGTGSECAGEMAPARLPEESAFRLRVTLARMAGFPSTALWRLPELRRPSPTERIPLRFERQLGKCRLRITEVVGKTVGDGWSSGRARLRVKVNGPSESYRLRARLNHGRFHHCPSQGGEFVVSLPDGQPGAPVDLELALTPLLQFDFLAAPHHEVLSPQAVSHPHQNRIGLPMAGAQRASERLSHSFRGLGTESRPPSGLLTARTHLVGAEKPASGAQSGL